MKPQFDNQVMSSFLLWFDHTLQELIARYNQVIVPNYQVISEELMGLPYYQM